MKNLTHINSNGTVINRTSPATICKLSIKEKIMKKKETPVVGKELFKIPLGLYASGEEYLTTIGVVLKRVSINARRVIEGISCSPVKNELHLWGASEAELGFVDGAEDPEDVWLVLEEAGFERCPMEAAPSACICSSSKRPPMAFCTEPLYFRSGARNYLGMDAEGLYTFGEDDVDPSRVWIAVLPRDTGCVRYIADSPAVR